jgi:multisubunit Na+/H+ antiporter MnhE subunit
MRLRPLILARLLARFLGHSALAGVTTARIILRRRQPPAGLVRLRYAPMSETGAAVLGAMVTLTPGSSVIDIDSARRELLVHLLDVRTAAAAAAAIRRDFERDIAALFPPEGA